MIKLKILFKLSLLILLYIDNKIYMKIEIITLNDGTLRSP
jgi:hypothetical protein